MSIVHTAQRVDATEVSAGRSSLTELLALLAAEPGQWMRFEASNASIATQIKRNKGYDARTEVRTKAVAATETTAAVPATYWLFAVYVGPDFVASFIPRVRKPKAEAAASQTV